MKKILIIAILALGLPQPSSANYYNWCRKNTIRLDKINNNQCRLATGIPIAIGGASLDLAVHGIGPMGRWAEKNPKLAASFRAMADILNDVQVLTNSGRYQNDCAIFLATTQLLMTIAKSTLQGFWDVRYLKSGKSKTFGKHRRNGIILLNLLSRSCQSIKLSGYSEEYIHFVIEPLLSGIATAIRAGKSPEQATNALFTVGRFALTFYLFISLAIMNVGESCWHHFHPTTDTYK
ncbi:hypothetical protein HOD08_01840 [bacterium]|nr:hypothetical protein [bacterium]